LAKQFSIRFSRSDKMGGDLEKIQTVGLYLIEVWKAAGMNLDRVVFRWASNDITNSAATYWPIMLDVARRFTIPRIRKCCQIMGRLENTLTAAQILYPLMQCTDIFFLKADICQLGVDQRKVNMLAREYCDAAKRKQKPIILSHHMLYGLKQGQAKMSKSDPDSAIFMEDSREDVARKINNAYCPTTPDTTNASDEEAAAVSNVETTVTKEGIETVLPSDDNGDEDAGKASMNLSNDTLKNPCLDYVQHIILSPPGATFCAAGIEYTSFADVRTAFLNGTISEAQLKEGLIAALNELLEPVRTHFATNEQAKELLQKIVDYKREAASADATVKTVRRLNLVQLSHVPAGSHLVLAPLPHPNPTLQEAMNVLARLRHSRVQDSALASQPLVLLLQDWSAIVCNACQADAKCIAAYYKILLTSLTALDPDLMAGVRVATQSEAILLDPSNYWINVINVGRHFLLDKVTGNTIQDSDGVGLVIARLMTIADVAGVEPTTLTLSSIHTVERDLIEDFFPSSLPGVTLPSISIHDCRSIRLQPTRDNDALATENDEYFLLDDPKVRGWSHPECARRFGDCQAHIALAGCRFMGSRR
jgi:tyrosyl-tRNA synthetase